MGQTQSWFLPGPDAHGHGFPGRRVQPVVRPAADPGRGADERSHVVPVHYDPDDPSRAQRADHPGGWLWKVFVGIGAVGWVVVVSVWWWRRSAGQG